MKNVDFSKVFIGGETILFIVGDTVIPNASIIAYVSGDGGMFGKSPVSGAKVFNIPLIRVEKPFRRQGVGTALLKKMCDVADENGYVLELGVSANEEVISIEDLKSFYLKFGFKEFIDPVTNEGTCIMYRVPQVTEKISETVKAEPWV